MVVSSLAELETFAAELSTEVAGGQLWCFTGELGAGKTELIRHIVASLSPNEKVTSPSYNLENRYPFAHGTICHWDLYRLGQLSILPDLDEQIGNSEVALFVEWPERYPELEALADFHVQIKVVPGTEKREIAIASKPKKF